MIKLRLRLQIIVTNYVKLDQRVGIDIIIFLNL